MIPRIPEPELMDEPEQARAYAAADFSEPNALFGELFEARFPGLYLDGYVLDLGCGPADIPLALARVYPSARFHGADGAAAMLDLGRHACRRAGLEDRVELFQVRLPAEALPRSDYQAVISNSLLHHLHDPAVLWTTIKRYARPGAAVLVMDLARPESVEAAAAIVQSHAAGEPRVLQRDFHNSLLAAFTPGEVSGQLVAAGLAHLRVEMVSDRHLAVSGVL